MAKFQGLRRLLPYRARNKPRKGIRNSDLNQIPSPAVKWHTVTMDFITHLPKSRQGLDAALVVTDKFTKRLHIAPMCTTASAPDVARIFFDTIVRHHGIPQTIISDRDTRFTSRFWQELFKLAGCKLALSIANHSQTDGQSERAIRVVKEALKHYINHSQKDWPDYIAAIEYAYNTACEENTNDK